MAGPLKRTKLRSSPEEAEWYRRFHDRGVAALRQGISRDALLKELQEHGVPLLSAERLVTAFEQEASLSVEAGQIRGGGKLTGSLIAILVVGVGFACYFMWTLGHEGKFRWGYAAAAILITVIAAFRRLLRR